MKKIIPRTTEAEFIDFLKATESQTPKALSDSIKNHIQKDLSPSRIFVISKIFVVQFLAGLSTLSICSQFGLSFFGIEGLWSFFQKFGDTACMALCGGLFIGSGASITMLVLRPEEIRVIWKDKWVLYLFFTLFYMGLFSLLGTQHNNHSMMMAWLVGGFTTSQIIIKLIKDIRFPHWDPSLKVAV